jgi:hypothetical protein
MARRQQKEVLGPGVEERIGGDDDGAGMQLDQGGEGVIASLPVLRLQDMKL